jgi:hypothetical protein
MAPGSVSTRPTAAEFSHDPPRIVVSAIVPPTVNVFALNGVPLNVPVYRQLPPIMLVSRMLILTVTVLLTRLVLNVLVLENLALVIVPLQPLATNPVTAPVVEPDVLAATEERLQLPLPSDDMVLNLPVPDVVP